MSQSHNSSAGSAGSPAGSWPSSGNMGQPWVLKAGAGGVQEGEPSRSPMLFSGPSASIARPRHNCPVGAQGAGRGSQELGDGVASKQAWLGSSQGCSLGSGLARLLSLPGGCPS